ncbi:co-chaperone GroES [Candidatus Pacearchaeota archaeon]|jgi:chaperonin GroES|nr:co-chaperone GroES [bacterium]MCK9597149.1 co-chaperone GroES [Candidatus Pacearchaeota archaeon]
MLKKILNDSVVFEMPDLTKETVTKSGIILPDGTPLKTLIVDVYDVGTGFKTKDGNIIPLDINKGDKILVPFGKGYPVKVDEKTYIFIKYEDVFAKVEE